MERKFLITSWSELEYNNAVKQLEQYGVNKNEIELVTSQKISRPRALNAAIKRCDGKFIFLIDGDIRLLHFNPERCVEILETRKDIGLVALPALQIIREMLGADLRTPIPHDTPIRESLKNISPLLATLNCVVIRKSDNIKFDEELVGNQQLDADFGWELLRKGLKSVADCSQGLIHTRTNWAIKNIIYHAIVARNLHILTKKWQNREVWPGVEEFNKKHNNEIPTIEEFTAWSDENLYNYIIKFDKRAIEMYYHKSRFSDIHKNSSYVKTVEKCLKQQQKFQFYSTPGGLPNFTVLDI